VEIAPALEEGWVIDVTNGSENKRITKEYGDIFEIWAKWQFDFFENRGKRSEYPRLKSKLEELESRDLPLFIRQEVNLSKDTLNYLERLENSSNRNKKYIENKRLKNGKDV
jgi:hypothetical protein